MTSPSWGPNSGGSDSGDTESGLVRWRRRGRAAELRFVEPARSKKWRRNVLPSKAMPALTSFGWWLAGTVTHATASVGALVGFGAAGVDLLPVWIAVVAGLAVPPAAGVGGFFHGKRRQREADARALAIGEIDSATTQALGRDVRGVGGKSLSQKIASVMRHGRTEHARLLTASGYVEYRIDPVDRSTVAIEPLGESPEARAFNETVRKVNAAAHQHVGIEITVPTDRRVAGLEQRLAALEKVGGIDVNHPSYPQFVILQVDRLTEYRRLASRAEAIGEVESAEARAVAAQLSRDLDDMVELMSTGVDELERQVLADSKRTSDAYLGFLREKYATPESRHGSMI
ncbi:MAG: hypothetical protein ACTH31_13650 [Pseudoclavibacter sp.]